MEALPLSILASSIIVILGWYVIHRLSTARDLANKRRELRVSYLIEAYRRLEYVSNRPIIKELAPEFEKAVADIQLFGTPKQVQLAQEFARGFAGNGTHALDPLMSDLRADLREELNLQTVPSNIVYLRINYNNATSTSE
jgi:hypothetical protein